VTHEFNGEQYKKASSHQKEWGNKIIAEFHLKGNERILDLGCGDGNLTSQLAELVPDGFVLGIDGSVGMIEEANKIRKSNLSFLLKDINKLDFNNEFDLIFSNATLHWVKNHNRLLQSTFDCLRPDGLLRFNFGAEGNCYHFIKVARIAMSHPQFSRYFLNFEWPWFMPAVDEYEALVRQFPFRDIQVWGEVADRCFPDSQSITLWIDQPSIVPLLECIDKSDKQAFRDFVVEKMLEDTRQIDERYFETFRRVNLSARK
jgi:trans-aconitate 2-methyltransferase